MNNGKKLTEEIEKVLQSGGGSALFDREIVAVLLGAVHDRKQAQDVTKTLMDNCPRIGEILGREIDDLKMIEGMTEHAAAAIECVKEAYKRALREGLKRGPVMDSQEKLIEYVRVNIGFSAKEAVQIIYLDKQHRLIRDEVYFGTIDEVHLSERKVVKKALSIIQIFSSCCRFFFLMTFLDYYGKGYSTPNQNFTFSQIKTQNFFSAILLICYTYICLHNARPP